MILNIFRSFGRLATHTPRTNASLFLLFALLLGTLPLNARLVLRHTDKVLSPADTVRISVVEERTEYPSDDPANPKPYTVVELKYPDIHTYTVGTEAALTAPLDFSAKVENISDFSLKWCGLMNECSFLAERGDHETRNARLTAEKARLPLELEGHFEPNAYGHAVARLTLTPTAPAEAPTTYVVRFTYSAPSALRRITTPLPADAVLYDLTGRRILRPRPGHIYLRAGRKVLAQ